MILQVVKTIGVVGLVFGSLITFPSSIHWMVAIWVAIGLRQSYKNKPLWPWIVVCVLITGIKRPGWTIEFWILVGLLCLVAGYDWRTRVAAKLEQFRQRRRLAVFSLVLLAGVASYGIARWSGATVSRQIALDERPIVCLGDSLTASGYPRELQKLISVPVLNFGFDGIKTDDGIKILPNILAENPQLVVLELGGHDYNADKKPRAATRANLIKLIESFREQDIAVVLVEIPRGFVSDPYDGLERELAARYDLQLIDDSVIRRFVFFSPIIPPGLWLDPSQHYSEDGLHPNKLGNQHFAKIVSQALVKVFGVEVLK